MRRFGRWPEVRYGEARVEVDAEVVHPADGEHDVHAELGGEAVSMDQGGGGGFAGGGDAYFEDLKIGAARIVGCKGGRESPSGSSCCLQEPLYVSCSHCKQEDCSISKCLPKTNAKANGWTSATASPEFSTSTLFIPRVLHHCAVAQLCSVHCDER